MQNHLLECRVYTTSQTDSNKTLLNEFQNFIMVHSANYLFDCDKPIFIAKEFQGSNRLSYLKAVIDLGDNIQDEWFIALLLFKATEIFPLTIQMKDSDGEFLLIEGADYLDQNIVPENSHGRTFVMDNKAYLIPIDLKKGRQNSSIENTLRILWESPKVFELSNGFQNVIYKKFDDLECENDIPISNVHNYNVKIPFKIATIFQRFPFLVSKAIKFYCQRDLSDNHFIRRLENFKPERDRICLQNVRFSRFLFAQLSSAKLFGHSAFISAGYSDPGECNEEEDLGQKLAMGMEIIISRAESFTERNDFETEKILSEEFWTNIEAKLRRANCLENDEICSEKEKKVRILEILAQNGQFRRYSDTKNEITAEVCINQMIKLSEETLKSNEKQINLNNKFCQNDSTDWMEIDENQLENFFSQNVDFNQDDSNKGITKITSQLEEFLAESSGLEGIEFPAETNRNFEFFDFFESEKNSSRFAEEVETDSDSEFDREIELNGQNSAFEFEEEPSGLDFRKLVKSLREIVAEHKPDDPNCRKSSPPRITNEEDETKWSTGDYQRAMDAELEKSQVANSFETEDSKEIGNTEGEVKRTTAVDLNLTKNFLSSLEEQQGGTGPTLGILSNLLNNNSSNDNNK